MKTYVWTHEEGHGQRIENKDEQELEEMCSVVRESDHPIRADGRPISATAINHDYTHLH